MAGNPGDRRFTVNTVACKTSYEAAGVDRPAQAHMEEITWPFVVLMAVLVAGQAFFLWIASR